MDLDIQAVESKLSDVTVTPIPRSQVQNFYNYQQQREQREQQPQIQISAIHHPPRDRSVNCEHGHYSASDGLINYTGPNGNFSMREVDFLKHKQAAVAASAAVAAAQYQLQQLLQQQSNTTAAPSATSRMNHSNTSSSSSSAGSSNNNGNGSNSAVQSQLKYPQSTSPVIITTQTSANITTPMTSTANLPTVGSTTVNNGLSKYAQLLAVIEEMGRDIRPTYTGSRNSTERLKRGIVHARILVRECLMETERSARQ